MKSDRKSKTCEEDETGRFIERGSVRFIQLLDRRRNPRKLLEKINQCCQHDPLAKTNRLHDPTAAANRLPWPTCSNQAAIKTHLLYPIGYHEPLALTNQLLWPTCSNQWATMTQLLQPISYHDPLVLTNRLPWTTCSNQSATVTHNWPTFPSGSLEMDGRPLSVISSFFSSSIMSIGIPGKETENIILITIMMKKL